jgi:hypothetical protein
VGSVGRAVGLLTPHHIIVPDFGEATAEVHVLATQPDQLTFPLQHTGTEGLIRSVYMEAGGVWCDTSFEQALSRPL